MSDSAICVLENPSLRFASLGSGSRGNACVVEASHAQQTVRVLLDCGFGPRELTRRLARLDLLPTDLDAVLITHEHSDHLGGLAAGQRKFGWPVYCTAGTARTLHEDLSAFTGSCFTLIPADYDFTVGDLQITAFAVPHDAREPCQYRFRFAGLELGTLSDLGRITEHVLSHLQTCHALLLECNHDTDLLAAGPYPYSLKQRVGGDYGHLSNAQAAGLVAELVSRDAPLNKLALAHLSEKNNTPEKALAAIHAVQPVDCHTLLTNQADGCEWLTVESTDSATNNNTNPNSTMNSMMENAA